MLLAEILCIFTVLITDHLIDNMLWVACEIGDLLVMKAGTVGGDIARLASMKRLKQPTLKISPLIGASSSRSASGRAMFRRRLQRETRINCLVSLLTASISEHIMNQSMLMKGEHVPSTFIADPSLIWVMQ